MKLNLSPEIQKLINQRIRSGKYSSTEAVLTAALANLDQQDHLSDLTATELESAYPGVKAKLAKGLASARVGKLSDGEEFFDELEDQEKTLKAKGRKTA